ncbi:glycosyltransferase family 2 protein [Microbacterium sp. SLBN-146]|uniref:glycosyltransferase family 2 protein n=1 Tax=Microbacterium sp. SLBN-146 TaxID=2768457 RepID=UPI00114E612B|nr:glycosyltransferase family 2 protein [Microbacterium sp. SLBN-146]TQJ29570.1 GT2 family glycosyltransferase [Microbacterium sp. SLBN-146]
MKLIVVVAFNVTDLIRAQSETLRDWLLADESAHLVVLDNSASEETIAIVRDVTTDVSARVIAEVADHNAGFSPAVNDAVTRAEAAWGALESVALLNPDVTTDAATIAAVFAGLDDPRVGISAPLLVDEAGAADRGSLRRAWNRRRLFAEVVGAPGLARVLGSPARSIRASRAGRIDVDFTSGAYMAIRREVVGEGLDTRLPMYLEDQEICHRARRAGLAVRVDTRLRALHTGGHSRKSHTAMARQLRQMELATAPAMSWLDHTGSPAWQVRAVIGLAAAARMAIAGAAVAASVIVPSRREWAHDQWVLGGWLLTWATDPHARDHVEWTS